VVVVGAGYRWQPGFGWSESHLPAAYATDPRATLLVTAVDELFGTHKLQRGIVTW
jgi:hypothetical protein